MTDRFGIESIEIKKFRHFKPITVKLGKYLTLISGQNGTGKSTLLGMLGQPFGLKNVKDVFGKDLRTKYTDIFKLSPEHDIPGDHLYFVNLNDDELYQSGSRVQVKSFPRDNYSKLPIRFVTGATRNKGDGNVDYPVIYLGLKRTYPVGEIRNIKPIDAGITAEEVNLFQKWYSSIFLSWQQENVEPIELDKNSANKHSLLVNTDKYDFLANSAGQDNVGQILAALISFKRLKEGRADFRGGLLLIDELDVTLFPASQEQLLKLLLNVAKELSIQIVFTTHSLALIEGALAAKSSKNDIAVVYLRRRDSGISLVEGVDIKDIASDLYVKLRSDPDPVKIEVWCEDEEAAWFLRKIMPAKIAKKCNVINAGLSCGELGELSTRPIKSLSNVLFVVDGDSVKNASKKIRESKRLCILPTKDKNPERAIYEDLCALSDDDAFWLSMEDHNGYSKQAFMRSYENIHSFEPSKDRIKDKKWLKQEKRLGHWGSNGSRIISEWKKLNKADVDEFNAALDELVDRYIRRKQAANR